MRVAIMQPYFLPYIGYWQLMKAVDKFVIYDNIKFTKKGWINRNRFLQNGREALFSLPLKKSSDSLHVCEKELAPEFDRRGLLARIKNAYRNAPFIDGTCALLERIIFNTEPNLFRYVLNSAVEVKGHLGIETKMIVSSSIPVDHSLCGEDKVLAICHALNASSYVNPIGGQDLYSRERFQENGIQLSFLKPRPHNYSQFEKEFVPWLSIVDVLMFNPIEEVGACLRSNYELI